MGIRACRTCGDPTWGLSEFCVWCDPSPAGKRGRLALAEGVELPAFAPEKRRASAPAPPLCRNKAAGEPAKTDLPRQAPRVCAAVPRQQVPQRATLPRPEARERAAQPRQEGPERAIVNRLEAVQPSALHHPEAAPPAPLPQPEPQSAPALDIPQPRARRFTGNENPDWVASRCADCNNMSLRGRDRCWRHDNSERAAEIRSRRIPPERPIGSPRYEELMARSRAERAARAATPANTESGLVELRCSHCEKTKPIEAFGRSRQAKNRAGRNWWCRECCRESNRKNRPTAAHQPEAP